MAESTNQFGNTKLIAVFYLFVESTKFLVSTLTGDGASTEPKMHDYKMSEIHDIISVRDSTGRPLIYTPEKLIEIQGLQLDILKDMARTQRDVLTELRRVK